MEQPTGAREQFRQLWLSSRPTVATYLLARCGDPVLVDDLLQETALAAWRGWSRRTVIDDPPAWLLGIARHKLADHYRQRPDDRPIELLDEASAATFSRQRLAQLDGRGEAMRHCLRKLPAEQARLLQARYADTHDTEAIARLLSLTPANVKVRLYRIRLKLRRCIERYLSTEGDRP